jgi:hypothetical protein
MHFQRNLKLGRGLDGCARLGLDRNQPAPLGGPLKRCMNALPDDFMRAAWKFFTQHVQSWGKIPVLSPRLAPPSPPCEPYCFAPWQRPLLF